MDLNNNYTSMEYNRCGLMWKLTTPKRFTIILGLCEGILHLTLTGIKPENLKIANRKSAQKGCGVLKSSSLCHVVGIVN